MGYCHCQSCRSWSGGPVNAFSLWRPNAVQVTAGAGNISGGVPEDCSKPAPVLHKMRRTSDDQSPSSGAGRCVCKQLPTIKFKPAMHINYAETVLPMRDGLPKFKDFPADVGGSGEQMPE